MALAICRVKSEPQPPSYAAVKASPPRSYHRSPPSSSPPSSASPPSSSKSLRLLDLPDDILSLIVLHSADDDRITWLCHDLRARAFDAQFPCESRRRKAAELFISQWRTTSLPLSRILQKADRCAASLDRASTVVDFLQTTAERRFLVMALFSFEQLEIEVQWMHVQALHELMVPGSGVQQRAAAAMGRLMRRTEAEQGEHVARTKHGMKVTQRLCLSES